MELLVVARKYRSKTKSTSVFKWLAGRSKNNLISTLPGSWLPTTEGHLKGEKCSKLLFVTLPEETATISAPAHS